MNRRGQNNRGVKENGKWYQPLNLTIQVEFSGTSIIRNSAPLLQGMVSH